MKVRVNIWCLSFILTLLTACTVSNEELDNVANTSNDKVMVTLGLDVPNLQVSRSLTLEQESSIGDYALFAYEGETLKTVLKKGDEDIKLVGNTLYALLPETKNNVDLLLFNNIDLTKVGTIESYSNKTKAQIFADFEYSCATQLSKQNVPMYGKTTLAGVTLGSKGTIKLIRSMAKVTVNVNDTKFVPKSIEVINVEDNATVYYTNLTQVNAPGTSSIVNKIKEFGESTTASVYLGETINSDSKPVSVILYGKYNNQDAYYRFDMIQKEGGTKLTQLLRNHHYIFLVSGINHLGSGRRQDAIDKAYADNEMVVSDVEFFDITDPDILSITSDDASYVGVSSENITMKLSDNKPVYLDVLTNNTATSPAWSIDTSECEGVFEFSQEINNPQANVLQTLWIYKTFRTAVGSYVFYITAGNIRKGITVIVN